MSDKDENQGAAFRRILVGADEDGRSNAGLDVALDLAERFDARCELVHAVQVPPSLWPKMDAVRLAALNAETLTSAWRGQRSRLGVFLESLGRDPHEADDLLQVLPGSPAGVILQRIADWRADLVVLGPHRRRGFIDFGSTARAILAETRVPVWVQPGPVRKIKTILAPVDQSHDSLVALDRAAGLAAAFGAKLKIMHCFVPPDFAYPASVDSPIPSPAYVVDEIRASTR
ncbi:MAG: universal stress protein, partial [Planctomycetota bacterium]|nr:universal stress protein [Planctomycetota bacterium]